ncbi:MAG: efflux RND transporter periplasmic adaptor subunit [Myxococcaceae bacterium]
MRCLPRSPAWFAAGMLVWALGCGEKAPPPLPPPTVLFAAVVKEDVPVYAEFVGTVNGYLNVEIRARVAGFLQAQDYKDGAYVKTGSLLFTIDPAQYQAQVLQSQGNLAQAQALLSRANVTVQRYRPLAAKQAISQQDLDNALASQEAAVGQMQASKAALEQSKLNLSYTKIYSPVDGIVGTAQVNIGNLVGQGTPTLLTTVSQVEPAKVIFNVSEADYLRYATNFRNLENQDAAATSKRLAEMRDGGTGGLQLLLADNSLYPYQGFIIAAQRQVQTSTGTLQVEAVFPNPNALLRPGQYARVRGTLPGQGGNTLLVPQAAVTELQGGFTVAVVTADNKVQIRTVEVGPRVGAQWIITSGLNAGERVIVEGLQKVTDGTLVKPEPAPAAASPTGPAR